MDEMGLSPGETDAHRVRVMEEMGGVVMEG